MSIQPTESGGRRIWQKGPHGSLDFTIPRPGRYRLVEVATGEAVDEFDAAFEQERPCVHLGGLLRVMKPKECGTCGPVAVHACAVHRQCVTKPTRQPIPGAACCEGCESRS